MKMLHLGASFLVTAMRDQGHQVLSAGLGGDCDIRITHPITCERLLAELAAQGFAPDAALWLDNGNLPFLVGVERLDCPSLFYSIDTYCNPWHIPFAQAFDLVRVAQKGYTKLFAPQTDAPVLREPVWRQPAWLPLFAPVIDPARIPDPLAEADARRIPVAFVGSLRPRNIPQRIVFLEQFRQRHPLVMREGDYVPVFAQSRIVLNQSAAGEVNFRCFEALACGAALLTETSDQGLCELLTPGEHMLPPYPPGDAAKAAHTAREWLQRPHELARVAAAGMERVRARHTAAQRAADIAQLLEQAVADTLHLNRQRELPRRRTLLATAYAILADELTDPGVREHRDFYRNLFEELCRA